MYSFLMDNSEYDYQKESAALRSLTSQSPDHRAVVTVVLAQSGTSGCLNRISAISTVVGVTTALLLRERMPATSMLGGTVALLSGVAWSLGTLCERWARMHANALAQTHEARVRMILQSIRERMPSLVPHVEQVEHSLFPKKQ